MEGFPKRMFDSYGFWLSARPLNCKVRFRFFFCQFLQFHYHFLNYTWWLGQEGTILKTCQFMKLKKQKTKNKTKQLKTSLLRFRESQSDFFHHRTFFF